MSVDLHIQCPACGAWRTTPDYTVGLTVICSECQGPIQVVAGAEPPPATAEPEITLRPSPEDDAARAVHDAFADGSEEPEPVIVPQVLSENRCTRCQRDFKGDWDRFEASDGMICYNCSNLATDSLPDRVLNPEPEPEVVPEVFREELEISEQNNVLFDPKSEQFQKVLLWVALGTVAFAFLVMITGYGSNSGGSGSAVASVEPVDMPAWLSFAYRVAMASQTYLTLGLAIFIAFRWWDRLPQDTSWAYVLYISGIVGACIAMRMVHGILWLAWMQHDANGDMYSLFLFVAIFCASFVLVYRAFDWRFRDFLVFVLVWGLSKSIVATATVLIFGAIALAVD